MRLKVCGITDASAIKTLDEVAVDFVGLWHGIRGGHADLSLEKFAHLAAAARATGRLTPVLVTFLGDVAALCRAVQVSGVQWVQLHGFQTPALVHALRGALPTGTTLVKVLHVSGGRCVERPVIRAYEAAGTDLFLMDSVTADGRVGSTGQVLDEAAVLSLADEIERPFFLAGGISADAPSRLRLVMRHDRFFGIDVDSNARDATGRPCPTSITAISHAWSRGETAGGSHDQRLR